MTAGERPDLALVRRRILVEEPVDSVFALTPGDRALVAVGASVVVGAPLADRVRDARIEERSVPAGDGVAPGSRWPRPGAPPRNGPSAHPLEGELLYEWHGRWRVATGDLTDILETPFAGIVRDVQPGIGITVRAAGRGLRGVVVLGGPTRGRLRPVIGSSGELRPGGLDVGSAGAILVVGSRVDAETLTRARAMGIRGVIVAGLASKERRDFLASEARQRAALHRLPPFAVLVLDGAVRRPLAGPVASLLAALAGREVAIVSDPPMLVFDEPELVVPAPPEDLVRIRAGALAGVEARWVSAAGRRRFPGGAHLEAGIVELPDARTVAVPLGDLERFG